MWTEVRRPKFLSDVVGHSGTKERILSYLKSPIYSNVLLLHGPPGIGKTTMVLAATQTCGMEALEINASRSLRSHSDVEQIVQSCRNTRSIVSMMRGDHKPMCIIFDEIDGSDPHAQRKLVEWMTSSERKVPVLLTCNDIPRILKNKEGVEVLRCYPPKAADLISLFPDQNVAQLSHRFKHDIRRILQFLQYGESDTLPPLAVPANASPEVTHMLKQKMYCETDPIIQAIRSTAP